MTTGIGQPVRRKEDARLVIGAGCFSDDVDLPRQARAFVLRSVHAHARIKGIDTARAKALKGVLAVLTGADLKADGIKPIPPDASITVPVEAQRKLPGRGAGQQERAVSADALQHRSRSTRSAMSAKAVVLVVAETLAIAKDAAELVEIDYEPLPAVTDTAAGGGARCARCCATTRARTSSATPRSATRPRPQRRSSDAAHVVRLDTWVQRVTGVPMEARTAVGHYDKASGRYFLHAGSGGVVRQKGECAAILGVPPEQGAGGGARHRRQFRHQEFAVPGIPAGAVGVEARRPPGEMDLRAQRSVPQRLSGPRPRRQGRACDRRQGKIPGDARLAPEQHRRLCRLDRAAAQGADDLHQRLSTSRSRTSAPMRCSATPCARFPIAAPAGRRRSI